MKTPKPKGMSRRVLLAGAACLVLVAGGQATETLPVRKARFTESGRVVKMQVSLPELLDRKDRDAMESVSSGFATRLVYEFGLFRWGERTPVAATEVEVRIHWDPWNRDYVVRTKRDGTTVSTRRFQLRDDAVTAATKLRVPVAEVQGLERGSKAIYVVRILGMRNPLRDVKAATPTSRGGSRDWFGRWVRVFVRSHPRSERSFEWRSSAFYLEEK